VEKALAAVPGVTSASVNLASERATVTASGGTGEEALRRAVEAVGYHAQPVRDAGDGEAHAARKEAELARLNRDLIVAAVLTLPVFAMEMGSHFVPAIHDFVMRTIGMQES